MLASVYFKKSLSFQEEPASSVGLLSRYIILSLCIHICTKILLFYDRIFRLSLLIFLSECLIQIQAESDLAAAKGSALLIRP